jgi:hypothetical protein
LLLSWHHIEEILKHGNDAVFDARTDFLQSLPLIGWVGSFTQEDLPGSLIDMLAYEVMAGLAQPLPLGRQAGRL